MFGFILSLLLSLLILLIDSADPLKEVEANRHDPNYSEEFVQIYDARLSALIICLISGEYIGEPNIASPKIEALRRLNLGSVRVIGCASQNITSNPSPQNRTQVSFHRIFEPGTADLAISIVRAVDILFLLDAHDTSLRLEPQRVNSSSLLYHCLSSRAERASVFYIDMTPFSGKDSSSLSSQSQHRLQKQMAFRADADIYLTSEEASLRTAQLSQYYSHYYSQLMNKSNKLWPDAPPQIVSLGLSHPLTSGSTLRKLEDNLVRVIIDTMIAGNFKRFIRKPAVLDFLRKATSPLSSTTRVITTAVTKTSSARSKSKRTHNDGVYLPAAHAVKVKYAAVIIETRIDPAFEFCVRNVMYHLNSGSISNGEGALSSTANTDANAGNSTHSTVRWGLLVYHSTGPTGNEHYVKSVLSAGPDGGLVRRYPVQFIPIPKEANVDDGDSYNQLVRSVSFWEDLSRLNLIFPAQQDVVSYVSSAGNVKSSDGRVASTSGIEKVLLFQMDSVMLHGDISPFLKYDYVGAPWHLTPGASSAEWLRNKQKHGMLRAGVGNGGFSLRSVDLMLAIAKKHGSSGVAKRNNEDVFFAHFCERMTQPRQCRVADRQAAYQFAVEIPCNDLNITFIRKLKATSGYTADSHSSLFTPMALHNTWAYVSPQATAELLSKSVGKLQ